MNFRRLMSAALAALFVLAPLSQLALADEGMWAFNNVPRAEIKRRYGFDVTDAFLMKLQQASVRFPNGSGSFRSEEHTSELQSRQYLVCRLLLEKKKNISYTLSCTT